MSSTAIQHISEGAVYESGRSTAVAPLVATGLIWANVFLCGAYFRGQVGIEEFTIHWQILMRLGIACLSGLAGLFWLFHGTWRDFLSGPGLLITLYATWYGIALPFAIETTYSLAAWASLVSVLLLIPGAMRVLGGVAMLRTIAFALMCYIVGSWFVWQFVPSIGVYREWLTDDLQIERMGGLGHPNALGLYCAFAILVFVGLLAAKQVRKSVALLCIGLAAVTLIVCFSRTSMIACLFGLTITLQYWLRMRTTALIAVAGCLVLTLLVFVVLGSGNADWTLENLLLRFTKSGSINELTTATGRTEVWKYGVEKIAERPIFGYGYCSGRFVMEYYSYHCHNVVLNAALYGGIASGLLLLFILGYLAWSMFRHPVPAIDGLAACIMLGGMFDELIVSASPSAAVVIWITIVFWRQLGMSLEGTSETISSNDQQAFHAH